MVATDKTPRRGDEQLTGRLISRFIDQIWSLMITAAILVVMAATGSISLFWAVMSWVVICLTACLSGPFDQTNSAPAKADSIAPSQDLIEQQKNETKSLIAALPDPCFLLHRDGRVIYQNEPASQAVGVIEPGTMIFSLIRAPELRDAIKQLFRERKPVKFEFVRPVPSERRFEIYASLITNCFGEPEDEAHDQIVLNMRDLTQQQRLDKMRADFVANASHELRTPLASLIGFIETLQGPARDDAKARNQFLEIMETQAQRMSRLIDDLLSLNRIEMNVHVRPQQNINFIEVVTHVIDALLPIAKSAKVDIKFEVGGDKPGEDDLFQVIGDRDELVQVVQNLVENAIKYGQDGKSVEINLTRETGENKPNQLMLTVRDYGPGIPQDQQPRLTERFYRVDVVSSREKGGTGLGLAIVKHILNRHHGRLRIESILGEGSTFIVTLPEAETKSGTT